jgi:hypothetical protein
VGEVAEAPIPASVLLVGKSGPAVSAIAPTCCADHAAVLSLQRNW